LSVVDPAGKNSAWPFSLELSAKLEESDEVGHRPIRVLVVGGEIGEVFLYPIDGGLDSGYQPLRGQVFRLRKANGSCIHQNLAGGVGLEKGRIF